MLVLSYLGHVYVYDGDEPCGTIPAAVGRPRHEVATAPGRPPVLSYASHALANWRRVDADQPVALDNIARLENFLGAWTRTGSCWCTSPSKRRRVRALAAGIVAQDAVAAHDSSTLTQALEIIAETLEKMLATLRRMPEKCVPYIYYTRVRPFIFGWMGNPAFPDYVRCEGWWWSSRRHWWSPGPGRGPGRGWWCC